MPSPGWENICLCPHPSSVTPHGSEGVLCSPGTTIKALKLMDPITDCFQSSCTEKREEITFKEECEGVCKDDSSPTVAHVCPHHQLQVLLCFFGHLCDGRDRQRAELKASDGFKDKQANKPQPRLDFALPRRQSGLCVFRSPRSPHLLAEVLGELAQPLLV